MRRARRSFWLLVAVAVLATGVLSKALVAEPGPLAGTTVALSGLVLAASLTLAVRIFLAVERHRGS